MFRHPTIRQSLKFVFASLIALTALTAQAAIDPERFTGSFDLKKDPRGLCDWQVRGFIFGTEDSHINVSLGGHFFPRVNEGRIPVDNELEVGYSQSYTTGNSLVFKRVIKDKINGERITRTATATLSNSDRTLTLHSVSSDFPDLPRRCIYSRRAELE